MLAVKTDGTLWAWGSGGAGVLGLGSSTSYSSPVQVGGLTTWASVSTGSAMSLAITTDGKLYGWGTNSNGQLGLGNTTNYSSCLLYTSPSPRDRTRSRMPSSA